jgi:SAM-dependent methyltransferase
MPSNVTAGPGARKPIIAADAEPAMVRVITERFPGLRAEHAILPALPFADGQFDVAVANFVINHVGDPAAAVTSLARVIRPGGRVALTCWYPRRMQATRIFAEAMSAAGEMSADGVPKTIPFQQYAEPAAFTGLLARAGLTEVGTEQVEWRHEVDPDQWWTDVIEGTARTAAVIARLDADATRRVKKEYDQIIDPFRHSDGRVSLAAAALLATGTRPR